MNQRKRKKHSLWAMILAAAVLALAIPALAGCSAAGGGKPAESTGSADLSASAAAEGVSGSAGTSGITGSEGTADGGEAASPSDESGAENHADSNTASGPVISFETTDLDGNPVRSEDIFSSNEITMVNVWGTFCGPCIYEMPELEKLSGRLADRNCGIVGLVCNVQGLEDSEGLESAQQIIADTGVTYLNLLPWDTFYDDLPTQFIPATFLIDANGQIIGEPAVGARDADDYEQLINRALQGQ